MKVTEQHTRINLTHIINNVNFTVGNLHPFYIYHFTVSAYTVAPGPYTDKYTVQTLEDSTFSQMRNSLMYVC